MLELQENNDPYHRPEKKVFIKLLGRRLLQFQCIDLHLNQILLLAGPPGLGKTTLAQVVAHHAGYNVVEINARFVSCFPDPELNAWTLS